MQELLGQVVLSRRETARDESYFWDNSKRASHPDMMVLQRTVRGACFIEKGGRRQLAGPGQALLFTHREDSSYGYAGEDGEPYVHDWISFMGQSLKPVFQDLVERSGPVVAMADSSEAALLFSALGEKARRREFRDRYEESDALYELLMAIYRHQAEEREQRETSFVAWEWIQNRYDRPLNIKELAVRLGVSREHLTRSFKARFGESPAALLRRLRMRKGQALVLGTRLSLDEVAVNCGYRDGNVFCRAYRQFFGASPMADRGRG